MLKYCKKLLPIFISMIFSLLNAKESYSEISMVKKMMNHSSVKEAIAFGKKKRSYAPIVDSYMENPEISGSFEKLFERNNTYKAKLFGVGLKLPLNGEYSFRKDISKERQKIADKELLKSLFEKAFYFRSIINDYFYIEKKVDVMNEMHEQIKKLLADLEGLVKGKHRSRFDKVRMEALFSIHSSNLYQTEAALGEISEIFNFYGVSDIQHLDLNPLQLLPLDEAMILSERNNVNLAIEQKMIEIKKKERDKAEKLWIPAIGFETSLIQEREDNQNSLLGFEVGISMEIPVFRRNREELSEKKSELIDQKLTIADKKREKEVILRSLHRKISLLKKKHKRVNYSSKKLIENAFILYREGESSIDDLIGTITESEEMNLVMIDFEHQIRSLTISFYKEAGFFYEDEINKYIEEVTK